VKVPFDPAGRQGQIDCGLQEPRPESIYTRFFYHKKMLTDAELKAATELDFENAVALVVTIGEGENETIIGGGRYAVIDETGKARSAEVAFTIEEDYHRQGMARILLHTWLPSPRKRPFQLRGGGPSGKQRHAHRLLPQRVAHQNRAWGRRRACDDVADGGSLLIKDTFRGFCTSSFRQSPGLPISGASS